MMMFLGKDEVEMENRRKWHLAAGGAVGCSRRGFII